MDVCSAEGKHAENGLSVVFSCIGWGHRQRITLKKHEFQVTFSVSVLLDMPSVTKGLAAPFTKITSIQPVLADGAAGRGLVKAKASSAPLRGKRHCCPAKKIAAAVKSKCKTLFFSLLHGRIRSNMTVRGHCIAKQTRECTKAIGQARIRPNSGKHTQAFNTLPA